VEIYESDREQVEALRKWWKENGGSIIIGVVLGLGAVVGWRTWRGYEQAQAVKGSVAYQRLVDLAAGGDRQQAVAQGEFLIADQPGSVYAGLAALLLAKVAAEQGDLGDAARRLEWVAATPPVPELEPVARLQLARVRLAEGKLEEALALTAAAVPEEFGALYAEVRGDILVARGEPESAREAYRRALEQLEQDAPTRALVQMKLDDLGDPGAPGASGGTQS
jgi:predicted negative regulator of RcsB-dependent stress response